MALHPSTRILLGLGLVVLSSVLGLVSLAALALSLASILWLLGDSAAWRWISRARLLLIVPPLISGYTLAGDGVFPEFDIWSPTWQGLAHGALQSLRLLMAILALRLALRALSKEQLSAGLMGLLSPLSYVGADVPTLARRLGLTFNYLDQLDGRTARELLLGSLMPQAMQFNAHEPVAADPSRLRLLDGGVLIGLIVIVLFGLLW
jgi:energy-coupling factor transporter transmembrane protein EcfT